MTSNEFIFEYFKADQDTGSGSYEKMLSCINTLDWNEIKPYLLKLRYFYFLKTSYWLIISAEVKRRNGWKCSCGERVGLQVHHLKEGNEHHGEEHILLIGGLVKGLQCLCEKCHKNKHDSTVKVKDAEKRRQRDNRKDKILSQLPLYPQQIGENEIAGSSAILIRRMLEELEHEHKIVIERNLYDGWKVRRV